MIILAILAPIVLIFGFLLFAPIILSLIGLLLGVFFFVLIAAGIVSIGKALVRAVR